MIERAIVIPNRLGLHARAAARFVRLASEYQSTVQLRMGNRSVNGKSLLDVLTLAASQGTELTLIVEGMDEKDAADAIEKSRGRSRGAVVSIQPSGIATDGKSSRNSRTHRRSRSL